jgi:Mlc titration factor MtfA (ptsG expression regulator)
MGIGLFISIIIIIVVSYFFYKSRQKDGGNYKVPLNTRQLLYTNVAFYKNLDDKGKALFEARVKDFLSNVAIRGVDVTAQDLDRVLVAAGAIIPIFAFPDWRYNNISEVLLYKGTFNREYRTDGSERNVLGLVGDGPMHREMILSQPSLRESFRNPEDGYNTAIHEFAHLIDKADGATDGVPEYLLARPYVLPWITRMHETIKEMKADKHSDINRYGATNDAEFFAVVSEYFFERPDELKAHHPELFAMLEEMFRTKEKA